MTRFQMIFLFILTTTLFPAIPSAAADDLGIYWDTAYTENSIRIDTFPSVHTGYLVLKDPTSALGVSGWECCVGSEGPAIFLSWVLEGQTLNLETPPCFLVGISAPPLPGGAATLLATFMTMVSEDLPVTFSVEPLFGSALPNQMSYDPADDPGNPRPMTPVTGSSAVAWINSDNPVLDVDRTHIIFEDTHEDYPRTESVIVSNAGLIDGEIEVSLSDTSGVFSLPGPSGLVTVPALGSVVIDVLFSPVAAEYYSCTLSLGGLLPEVLIEGTGIVGTISWTMPEHLDFGEVNILTYAHRHVEIVNTGQAPFPIHPVLPDSCSEFDIWPAGLPLILNPGNTYDISVKFSPTVAGTYTCTMTMGEILPDVTFFGIGTIPSDTSWTAPTELDLGNVAIGFPYRKGFSIRNNGLVPFFVNPVLGGGCAEFSLTSGAGYTEILPGQDLYVETEFAPVDEGLSTCTLDLGAVVPPVALSGTGQVPDFSWAAPSILVFGNVSIGNDAIENFLVENVGDQPFPIDVALPGTCPEFELLQGAGHWMVDPGSSQLVSVRFTPTAPDSAICMLDLGAVVPSVQLIAVGTNPVLDWSITGPDFDAVPVGERTSSPVVVTNTGDIPFVVESSLIQPCADFTHDSKYHVLDPGQFCSLHVLFTPTVPGTLSCALDLGDLLPDVPLQGLTADPFLDWTITGPDFEITGVGEADYGLVEIRNTGNVTFNISPAIVDPCLHFDLRSGGRDLRPGLLHEVHVDFRPTAPGPLVCVLDLGDVLPDLPLVGEAFPRPEGWEITPLSVDFLLTFVEDHRDEVIVFHNTGGITLSLDVLLDPPSPHFSLPVGGGQADVLPGYSHDVQVRFEPLVAGTDSAAVVLGAAFAPVPVTGVAEDKVFACLVQPDTLDFGAILLGQSVTLTFGVTNTGNQPLDLAPQSVSQHYSVPTETVTLVPGQMIHLATTYFPQAPGDHAALIDLGNGACQNIICLGTALADFHSGENRLGMFFDPGFTTYEFQTSAAPEIVTGYLVLSNPSESTGVGAWECAYDVTGNGQFLGWQFEGQAINVGEYNNLIVGIGGSPLPFGPTIHLATFQLLVPHPSDIQELILRPTQFPSIPGQMAWAPGGQIGVLLPMLPITGHEIVAWINLEISSVESSVPVATRLLPNVPNPFNPSTRVQFELDRRSNVRITIYDVTGRSILTLVDGFLEAGPHSRVWAGRDGAGRQAPSGPYFVRMVTEQKVGVRKILLLK